MSDDAVRAAELIVAQKVAGESCGFIFPDDQDCWYERPCPFHSVEDATASFYRWTWRATERGMRYL